VAQGFFAPFDIAQDGSLRMTTSRPGKGGILKKTVKSRRPAYAKASAWQAPRLCKRGAEAREGRLGVQGEVVSKRKKVLNNA